MFIDTRFETNTFTPRFEGDTDAMLLVVKCPTRECDNEFRVRLSDILAGPHKTVRSFCLKCGAIVDTTLTTSSTKRLGSLDDDHKPIIRPYTRAVGELSV